MGNLFSEVPTDFDEYIIDNKRHYPPMTITIYKNDVLQETFEAPGGFDLERFAAVRNQSNRKISFTSSSKIDEDERQGYNVYADDKKYVGIYKINSDLNHYISEELKGKPPMTVYVSRNYNIVDMFDAPSGFDLRKYALRFPGTEIMELSDPFQRDGEISVATYSGRSYKGVYKKVYEEPIKEPEQE
jgi:hypothetical protein